MGATRPLCRVLRNVEYEVMKLTKSETTPQLLTRLPESLPGASMAEMSAEDRPRERLVREGVTVLRSGELLGILLRTGFRG